MSYYVYDMLQEALNVLNKNSLNQSTKPAGGLYPHQWFWDSCFIAIGLRWNDINRSKQEIKTLLKGQWENGMIPHIIFSNENSYHFGPKYWNSSKYGGPSAVTTSCLTQPPMLAEAVYKIGQRINAEQRKLWYQETIPALLKYHSWLYTSRRRQDSPFISLIHPWECGMDNTPYWLVESRKAMPVKIKALKAMKQENILNKLRKDTSIVRAAERPDPADLYSFYSFVKKASLQDYNLHKIINSTKIPVIEDLLFNAILIRANSLLMNMSEEINMPINNELLKLMNDTKNKIKQLAKGSGYYSRNTRTNQLIAQDSVAEFMLLYSGALSPKQAKFIANKLASGGAWWPNKGITTVPINSEWFLDKNYWRGPVWVNINWLIIEGLKRYEFYDLASKISDQTINLIESSKSFSEYYSAINGTSVGANDFSWTAALYIDLVKQK
jgi:glycogen debranching enzyme